jgi:hypothetical protein
LGIKVVDNLASVPFNVFQPIRMTAIANSGIEPQVTSNSLFTLGSIERVSNAIPASKGENPRTESPHSKSIDPSLWTSNDPQLSRKCEHLVTSIQQKTDVQTWFSDWLD